MSQDRSPRRRPEAHNYRRKSTRRFRWGVPWRLIAVVAPLIFVAAVTYALMQSDLLKVQHVEVQGAVALDQQALVQVSGLMGLNMLSLPADAAVDRLEAIPEVRAAGVRRSWPNKVVIAVAERRPVAIWSAAGQDLPVDEEGVLLGAGDPTGATPRIVEVNAEQPLSPGDRVPAEAVAFARRIAGESPRFLDAGVASLEYEEGVGMSVLLESGTRVTFGDERSYEYKVAVLSRLLDQLASQGVQPTAVDLRFGERVTYE